MPSQVTPRHAVSPLFLLWTANEREESYTVWWRSKSWLTSRYFSTCFFLYIFFSLSFPARPPQSPCLSWSALPLFAVCFATVSRLESSAKKHQHTSKVRYRILFFVSFLRLWSRDETREGNEKKKLKQRCMCTEEKEEKESTSASKTRFFVFLLLRCSLAQFPRVFLMISFAFSSPPCLKNRLWVSGLPVSSSTDHLLNEVRKMRRAKETEKKIERDLGNEREDEGMPTNSPTFETETGELREWVVSVPVKNRSSQNRLLQIITLSLLLLLLHWITG